MTTGSRTGPRARAAQDRSFGDPYQRAQRPQRERLSAAGVIRLDPDVARVFRDAESVNEALRLVMRLARFGGGRPPAPPREYTPRGERPASAPRDRREDDDHDAPMPAAPRFDED